jgi:hypothetical protein
MPLPFLEALPLSALSDRPVFSVAFFFDFLECDDPVSALPAVFTRFVADSPPVEFPWAWTSVPRSPELIRTVTKAARSNTAARLIWIARRPALEGRTWVEDFGLGDMRGSSVGSNACCA